MRPYFESEFKTYAAEAVKTCLPKDKLSTYSIDGYRLELNLLTESRRRTVKILLEYNGNDNRCMFSGLTDYMFPWGYKVVEGISEKILHNEDEGSRYQDYKNTLEGLDLQKRVMAIHMTKITDNEVEEPEFVGTRTYLLHDGWIYKDLSGKDPRDGHPVHICAEMSPKEIQNWLHDVEYIPDVDMKACG